MFTSSGNVCTIWICLRMYTLEIPSWSLVHNPTHYKSRESRTLIVTAGDSWTWGDSLGQTKVREGRDDEQYRLDHVYGNLISQEIKADWINIALPGISNHRILNWVGIAMSRKLPYNQITCIITLTESGRHEEQRMTQKKYNLQTNLEHMLDRTYQEIHALVNKHNSVKFVIAHNFTDSLASARIPVCDKTWLEVMREEPVQNGTHIVVSEHIEQLNYDQIYPDSLEVMQKAGDRVELLDSCKYCNKEDSRHPTEQGHEIWATYLLNQL